MHFAITSIENIPKFLQIMLRTSLLFSRTFLWRCLCCHFALYISVGVWAFVIGLSQISSFFSFCRNLVIFRVMICVKRNLPPGLVLWSSLQTKDVQRRSKFHLIGFRTSYTPSTMTVWPIAHHKDFLYCVWFLYSIVHIFPEALHSY